MNLGQLRSSISRFPADMDSAEVVVVHAKDGAPDYDNLAAVAIPAGLMVPGTTPDSMNAIMLMTDSGALIYAKQGKAVKGDGTKYTEQELLDQRETPPEG